MTDATTPAPARKWSRRLRSLVAVFLVIAFGVTFLASGVGIWLKRSTLNDDVWAERVVPLGSDPAVQNALAIWTTNEIMQTVKPQELFADVLPEKASFLAIPLSGAVRTYVGEKVDEFYASDTFENLWVQAATRAHDAAVATLRGEKSAVVADDEKVQINLLPMIEAVLNDVLAEAPGLVGSDATLPKVNADDVPEQAKQRLADALGVTLDDDFGTITIYDGGKLSTAQTVVRWLDKLPYVLIPVTVILGAVALWISPRKRRTAFELLGAAAIGCIAVRRASFLLQDSITHLIKVDANVAAAKVIVASQVNPLTAKAATLLWILAALALIGAVTGPYPWARSLRSAVLGGATTVRGVATEKARAPETTTWITEHVDALRIAGWVVAALVLWFATLTWLLVIVLGLAVTAWQIGLTRVTERPSQLT